MHHSAFWSCFREYSRGLIQCSSYRIKLSHRYNTRANCKKKMEGLEQENRELREEVVTLRSGMGQTTVISEIAATTIPAIPVGATQQRMPNGYPWGMPEGYLPEGYLSAPSEIHDRMDGFQDQFEELQKEMKALRGKELFGKNVHDLCLVPNVKVPAKFKLPEFEKYKGNSCPQAHLVMYIRKMSTHTDDQRLLIHYFQDNLTGAASKWYMGLDSTHIRTFNDLAEAFVKQYKYNVDMAPDRDQLRAMMQKEKESFKEYAQRWREVAAQVIPPMEEKEMTKIFLKTLGPFYYEKMIASAPVDFTEMVGMGVRLEEAVREGRLVRNDNSSGS